MSPLRSLVATLLLFIAATCGLSSQTSEWRWELSHVNGSPEDLTHLVFADSLHGWAVGKDGIIFRTTDGGWEWESGGASNYGRANDLFFLTKEKGWIAFQTTLLATEDGGATWFSTDYRREIGEIFFVDDNRGWSVDRGFNHLYRTTDGGTTWTITDTLNSSIVRFTFVRDSLFFYSTLSSTFRSSDAGATWTGVNSSALNALHFIDQQVGWAGRDDDSLVMTQDGGRTWRARKEVGRLRNVETIDFTDHMRGTVVTPERLATTTDGGSTWSIRELVAMDGGSVFAVNNGHLFEAGTRGRMRRSPVDTLDWQMLLSASLVDLTDAHFFTSSEGIVAGSVPVSGLDTSGPIWRTTDGGAHWTRSNPFAENPEFLSIDVIGDTVWLVTGTSIYRSHDRGVTWRLLMKDVADRFNSIDFLDARNGWAVSDSTLRRTTDGGDRWEIMPPRTASGEFLAGRFLDLYFLTIRRGWLFRSPTIPSLHTTDGGLSWEVGVEHQPNVPMIFTDSLHGVTVSDSGRYYTNDGGDYWLLERSKTLDNPMLVFFDRFNGLALELNRLLATDDGGVTWERIGTIPYGSWRDFICPSDDECWIVGEKSRIVRLQRLASTVPTAMHVSGDALPVIVPNPARTSFTVENPDVSDRPASLLVVDNLGRTVIGPIDFAAGDERLQLRCAELPQGSYRLIVRARDHAVNIPLVIQR